MTSEQRREARYQRRQVRRYEKRKARSDAIGTLDQVFSFHNMFKYGRKCCNGVRWKASTQNFERHLFSGTAKRRRQILIAMAEAVELQINRNKCKVVDIAKPFRFCKVKFQLTETGAVKTHGCRDGMKRARRKLRYFKPQVDADQKTVEAVGQWLQSQTAYYENYNDHGRVLHLRRLYHAIYGGANHV